MLDSIKGLFADWQYTRGIVKSFIQELSDTDLDKPFPRKELNSIRKQCEELVQIQSCYIKGIQTGEISFHCDKVADISKSGLLTEMEKYDSILEEILEDCNGAEFISWYGDDWNIHRHLSAMTGHEQMHIGQIIGFCYATDIQIPHQIVSKMALDG